MELTFDIKQKVITNPLPKASIDDVYRKANLPNLGKKGDHSAFDIEMQVRLDKSVGYSYFTLYPGESKIVPAELADDAFKVHQDEGLVVTDGEPTLADKIQGLHRAIVHYQEFGDRQIELIMAKKGHNETDFKRLRGSDYRTFVFNQARKELIEVHLNNLMSPPVLKVDNSGSGAKK